MSRQTRRTVLASMGGAVAVGLAGCSQGGGEPTATETATEESAGEMTTTETDEMETTEMGTANVRVSHMSPDAPNVDVYVDGNRALSDVPFRTTSDYLEVPAGPHTVKITAAGDESTVAFEGEVELASDTDYTVAAIGELTSEDTQFRPLVLEDDTSDPGGEMARVRVLHASPDAPAVDVTVAADGSALFDGVGFGDSGYQSVPAGEYTLQIRGDTMENDGDVVADFDVSLDGGSVYTAFAAGYLSPDDEPTDETFDLTVVRDASY